MVTDVNALADDFFSGISIVPMIIPISDNGLLSCYGMSWHSYTNCYYNCPVGGVANATCVTTCDQTYSSDIATCVEENPMEEPPI